MHFPRQRGNCSPLSRTGKDVDTCRPVGKLGSHSYASPANPEGLSEHLKSVAFADGEVIFGLQGDRSELTVTGATGGRMFYRKVRLACRGRQWHHVALEFPLGNRRIPNCLLLRLCRSLTKPTEVDAPLHLRPSLNDLKASG